MFQVEPRGVLISLGEREKLCFPEWPPIERMAVGVPVSVNPFGTLMAGYPAEFAMVKCRRGGRSPCGVRNGRFGFAGPIRRSVRGAAAPRPRPAPPPPEFAGTKYTSTSAVASASFIIIIVLAR